MARKGRIINIEVGDRITKVCETVPRGKSYQITVCFMFQTPENSVTDGTINAPEVLASELSAQLMKHSVSAGSCVFTLVSGKVATREAMLPPVKDKNLKAVVEANASEYFPVDLSKYKLGYCLLERTTSGESPGCRVLVLAAPLTLLDGYISLASLCGLTIRAIDFSGNSQYQALRGISPDKGTLYVNVSCTSSYVAVMQSGRLLMQRSFTFGGDELVTAYMNAAGKSPSAYLETLMECSVSEEELVGRGFLSEDDVRESLSRLVSSIARSTDYFNSNHWDTQVENVVLMGECSHLAGLRDMVTAATGVDTIYLDNDPSISALSNEADSASFYIFCIGSSIAPVDLVPQKYKDAKKSSKSGSESLTSGIVICAMCILVSLALSGVAVLNYLDMNSQKEDLTRQIDSLQYTKNVYAQYLEYQAGSEALSSLSGSIDSPNDSLADFIRELERKMPEEITFLSAVCNRDSISMNVTVTELSAVAAVIVQLRTFDSIANVTLGTVTESLDDTGGTFISFALSCTYGTNPYTVSPETEG